MWEGKTLFCEISGPFCIVRVRGDIFRWFKATEQMRRERSERMLRQNLTKVIARTIGTPAVPEPDDFIVGESLQRALQEKIDEYALLTPPSREHDLALSDLFTDDTSDLSEPVAASSKAFWKPRTVLMAFMGLCVTVSVAYCGLCYWWISAGHPGQPTEPLALLSVAENESEQSLQESPGEGRRTLENIQTLQRQIEAPSKAVPETTDLKDATAQRALTKDLIAQAKPQAAGKAAPVDPDEKFGLLAIAPSAEEPTGRRDPFSPLVQEDDIVPVSLSRSGDYDVLDSMRFTGFIGDVTSKDKVAIIRLLDPVVGDRTLIKKVGESFTVEGETVRVKSIDKDSLTLTVQGRSRRMSLSPYSEMAPTAGNSGVISGTASGSAGSIAGAAAPSAAATAGQQSNGVMAELQEH